MRKSLITSEYNVINMESMQVRIDERSMKLLDELAEMLRSSRSEVMRRVIEGGIKELRMKIAMEKYIDNEFSLCRAAEFSGVSIQQMAKYLSERGIPFFKQSVAETERDAKEAQSWL
jgi:predicted HTH domain antitoxin